jgi:hypothetical protein
MEAQDIYKDVEPVEQTDPDGRKVKAYPADYLKFLWRIGIKLAPTFADGLAFNTKHLFTDEEYSKFPECENKPIRLIYLNPDIWTNERLDKEAWRFEPHVHCRVRRMCVTLTETLFRVRICYALVT